MLGQSNPEQPPEAPRHVTSLLGKGPSEDVNESSSMEASGILPTAPHVQSRARSGVPAFRRAGLRQGGDKGA